MIPVPHRTYIEKDREEGDRVFIVCKVSDEYVTGSFLNVVKWQKNSLKMKRDNFVKRFEMSPIQMK